MGRSLKSLRFQPGVGSGWGYTAGHWRADPPTGTPVAEDGGRTPPPPPVNSSSGGRHEPAYDAAATRLREATAANVAAHAEALAPRRWRPPEDRS
jgi:hypothetical protein